MAFLKSFQKKKILFTALPLLYLYLLHLLPLFLSIIGVAKFVFTGTNIFVIAKNYTDVNSCKIKFCIRDIPSWQGNATLSKWQSPSSHPHVPRPAFQLTCCQLTAAPWALLYGLRDDIIQF